MKRSALAVCAVLFSGFANATVLNFDDITLDQGYDSLESLGLSSYEGFSWSSEWYAGSTSIANYSTAASSGTQYLSNASSTSLTITSSTAFDFDGASFTTPSPHTLAASYAYDATETITISGYDAEGNLVGTVSGSIDYLENYWIEADFTAVYSIVITADHGWFTMDDFTYHVEQATAPVPLPATMLLFGTGLAGLGLIRSKKTS